MSRSKPIIGMWFTLTVLSLAVSMTPFGTTPSAPLFGMWPTVVVVWLIVALFFNWVVESTGLGAVQAAVVLALTQILGSGVPGVMLEGMAFGDALIAAGFAMLFWVVAAAVYGWLSSGD
jgi:hypothetical protein